MNMFDASFKFGDQEDDEAFASKRNYSAHEELKEGDKKKIDPNVMQEIFSSLKADQESHGPVLAHPRK